MLAHLSAGCCCATARPSNSSHAAATALELVSSCSWSAGVARRGCSRPGMADCAAAPFSPIDRRVRSSHSTSVAVPPPLHSSLLARAVGSRRARQCGALLLLAAGMAGCLAAIAPAAGAAVSCSAAWEKHTWQERRIAWSLRSELGMCAALAVDAVQCRCSGGARTCRWQHPRMLHSTARCQPLPAAVTLEVLRSPSTAAGWRAMHHSACARAGRICSSSAAAVARCGPGLLPWCRPQLERSAAARHLSEADEHQHARGLRAFCCAASAGASLPAVVASSIVVSLPWELGAITALAVDTCRSALLWARTCRCSRDSSWPHATS